MESSALTAFGILTLSNQTWEATLREWRLVEELGFDSAWVADHFVSPIAPEGDWLEGWTLLAALAAHTTSLRLGTLVSSMTLRNPAMLARQALTVDQISNGRLQLGLGAGQIATDHSMTGVPRWSPSERAARFREFVEVISHLVHNRVTTYRGEFYDLEGAVMSPQFICQPAPPLVIGALGPKMMRVAAEFADVWNTIGGRNVTSHNAFDDTRRRVQQFNSLCDDVGRNPLSVRRSFLAFSPYVDDDPWASEAAFIDFVESYRALGFEEIIFDMPSPEQRIQFEKISSGVLSTLQES